MKYQISKSPMVHLALTATLVISLIGMTTGCRTSARRTTQSLMSHLDGTDTSNWQQTEAFFYETAHDERLTCDELAVALASQWGRRTPAYDRCFVDIVTALSPHSEQVQHAITTRIADDPRLVRQFFLREMLADGAPTIVTDQHRMQREMRLEWVVDSLQDHGDRHPFLWILFVAGMLNRPELVLNERNREATLRLAEIVQWMENVEMYARFHPELGQFILDDTLHDESDAEAMPGSVTVFDAASVFGPPISRYPLTSNSNDY